MASSVRYSHLYRVLRDDEDISDGIYAQDPHAYRTIEEHVDNGSYHSSQYISTSASRHAAEDFARKGNNYIPGSRRIAVINTLKLGKKVKYTDLTDPDVLDEEIDDERPYYFARKFEEVVIEGSIPANCIEKIYNI